MENPAAIFNQLREGMPVVASDGIEVGRIKEIYTDSFRVDRRLQLDSTIPFTSIETISDDGVVLGISASKVGDLSLYGAPATRPPHAP